MNGLPTLQKRIGGQNNWKASWSPLGNKELKMKERLLNTRFWNDGWVRKLNPLERYLFIYFLTNEHTNISGIYELPLSTIAYDTGLDERDLLGSLLPRLQPKVYFEDGWIILTNFLKHQHLQSKSVLEGIIKSLNQAPERVVMFAKSRNYGEGMGRVWGGYHILEPEPEPEPEPERIGKKENLEEIIKNNMEYSYDEDIRDIRKKKKKISQEENKFLISIGILWVKKAMAYFNYKQENVPMKNIYYPIRACWERDKFTYQDFSDLFDYFLGSKIKEDDKLSFDLCMSEKYVAKYKIAKKNKKLTFAGIANEIKL